MLKKLSLLLKSWLLIVSALFSSNLNAQYSVDLIPATLKENAHCIIREYIREIEVKSINSSTENIRKVITILDKNGEDKAILALPYDNNSNITIRKIVLYDKNGNKIKNAKPSEIEDHPYSESYELYSENRLKIYRPINSEYPYNVEYEYQIDLKNVISYGCWRPFSSYDISAQHSKLILTYPNDIKINIKEANISKASSEKVRNQIVDTWEMNNIPAYEDEPFDVNISERIPRVYLMPDKIKFDKYEGSAHDWAEFGKWVNQLYTNRNELSESEKNKINLLLKGTTDSTERIRTLYEYMQNNTRYVLITLGIGGFQPADVKSVIETGYGDCKALTNYMYSLLKYIGIKSFPALVASGTYQVPVFSDFPNFQQFDHVILCVPLKKDTLWLECTDQKIPFGFLGDFTDDRNVLLITETGGKFAHTKRYNAPDNLRIGNSTFNIDAEGNASLTTETTYSGLQYDNMSDLLSLNYEEQKKWLISNSELPALKINSFALEEDRNSVPRIKISESSTSKNYCTFSGKYMLLPLNKVIPQKPITRMLKPRFSDIILNRSYIDFDTIVYRIPENMIVEAMPEGKNIITDFGEYTYSLSTDGNNIIYSRRFLLKQGRFEPKEYANLYNFILEISKCDNIKIMLTKKPRLPG